jgi:hypothetical protein
MRHIVKILLVLIILLMPCMASATIWFNQTKNIGVLYYCRTNQTTCELRNITVSIKNTDLFPDNATNWTTLYFGTSGSLAGDTSASTKWTNMDFNISTVLNASNITVEWGFLSSPTGAVTGLVYNSLNITANDLACLNFTYLGACNYTWQMPPDYLWQNRLYTSGYLTYFYMFMITARISYVSGMREGGRIGSTYITAKDWTITFNGSHTIDTLYNYSVAAGWNVATKLDDTYSFRSGIQGQAPCQFNGTATTITFPANFDAFRLTNCNVHLGTNYISDKTYDGVSIKYIGCNADYFAQGLASPNSEFYGSEIRFKPVNNSVACLPQGAWGQLMSGLNTTVYNTYVERTRQIGLVDNRNAYSGVTVYGAGLEYFGAILKGFKMYGGPYILRGASTNSTLVGNGAYVHQFDMTGSTFAPVYNWQSEKTNYTMFMVDCYWGAIADNRKVYWQGARPSMFNATAYETYSVLMNIRDSSGNPLSNVSVNITNGLNQTAFEGYTNIDGYLAVDFGKITNYTTNTMTDRTKNWSIGGYYNGQYTYKEVYTTSTTAASQRFIVKGGGTNITLPLSQNWVTNATLNQTNYIIIPYLNVKKYEQANYSVTADNVGWSNVTDYNPFTFTVRKTNYKTKTWTQNVTSAIADNPPILMELDGPSIYNGALIWNSTMNAIVFKACS